MQTHIWYSRNVYQEKSFQYYVSIEIHNSAQSNRRILKYKTKVYYKAFW